MSKLWDPGDRLEHWLVQDRFMGAWGVVYVLRDLYHDDKESRPDVLIGKTIRPEWFSDLQKIEQFQREAYAWLSLGIYKHIVRLYTVDRFFGQPFALAEYIPEVLLPNTLRGWIDSNIIELEMALRFGIQICRALSYARSCEVLIHQDLKPENIMITKDGVAKVTDWGLSRMAPYRASGISSTGDVPYHPVELSSPSQSNTYGTPGYAAPELYNTEVIPTSKVDIFSLGVILIEMISGKRPKAGTPTSDLMSLLNPINQSIRTELANIISACLSSASSERPDSVEKVENALKEAFYDLTEVSIEKPPGKTWETGADRGQRAYALFMLGRVDEAMKIQSELMREFGPWSEKGDQKEKGEQEQKTPIIVMDYKERGWKTIMPMEQIVQVEKKLAMEPYNLKFIDEAIAIYYLAGHLDRALELCLSWLDHYPNDQEKLSTITDILCQQGRWKEGMKYFDRIVALNPDNAEVWMKRCKYCEEGGDLQEATNSARRAVTLDPSNDEARILYGHCLAEGGNHQAALHEFQEASRLNPENASAWYNVGISWNKLGRPDLAFKNLMRAIEKEPKFAQALNTLGAISMQVHSIQEAIVFFERAIAADSHYARPWFNKGKVLELMRKYEQAREAYQTALMIDPNYELAQAALDQLETEHLL